MHLVDDVHKFRNMIELFLKSGTSIPTYRFNNFPRGQCLNTAQMLADFLKSKGYENVVVISGSSKILGSHAWISIGDLIVDITADSDQFSEYNYPPVFINKESRLHSMFNSEPSFQQVVGGDLSLTYCKILSFENNA